MLQFSKYCYYITFIITLQLIWSCGVDVLLLHSSLQASAADWYIFPRFLLSNFSFNFSHSLAADFHYKQRISSASTTIIINYYLLFFPALLYLFFHCRLDWFLFFLFRWLVWWLEVAWRWGGMEPLSSTFFFRSYLLSCKKWWETYKWVEKESQGPAPINFRWKAKETQK